MVQDIAVGAGGLELWTPGPVKRDTVLPTIAMFLSSGFDSQPSWRSGNDIAVGAGGYGFDPWAGQIGRCVASGSPLLPCFFGAVLHTASIMAIWILLQVNNLMSALERVPLSAKLNNGKSSGTAPKLRLLPSFPSSEHSAEEEMTLSKSDVVLQFPYEVI